MCCAININYAKYIKKYIAVKECTFKLRTHNYFVLSSGYDTAKISFKARLIHKELPPELIFAPKCVKNALIVSS